MITLNLKNPLKSPTPLSDVTPFAEGLSKAWAVTSESLGSAAEQADTSLGQRSESGHSVSSATFLPTQHSRASTVF